RLPRRDIKRLALRSAECEVRDQIFRDRDSPHQLTLRRNDIDAGRVVEGFAGAAYDGDAGRDPEIAIHVELHAVAAAAFAEIVDEPLPLGRAVLGDVEGPDFAVAAGFRMAVDDVESLIVRRDGDAVGPLNFLLSKDARHLEVAVDSIDAVDVHLQVAAVGAVVGIGEPDAPLGI